jgi:hypothetical protein
MPRELATSRRVRKGILPGVAPSGPQAAVEESGVDGIASAAVAGPVERVVADVRHEIGNYFHKLYYWADFLTESRAGRASDVTATQMLEDTIRGLEELLRATLEYVRPVAVVPTRMPAREVADAVVRQLAAGLDGREIAVIHASDLGDRTAVLDPGRMSQVLQAMIRRLEATVPVAARLCVTVALERRGTSEVLTLVATAPATPSPRGTVAEVEWATAENVVRLFGGELAVHDGNGTASVSLALPVRV